MCDNLLGSASGSPSRTFRISLQQHDVRVPERLDQIVYAALATQSVFVVLH